MVNVLIYLSLLILHSIVCVVVYQCKKRHVIRTTDCVMPAVICIPVVGVLLAVFAEFFERNGKMGQKDTGLDRLKIREVRFQRIEVSDNQNQNGAVPLEEAILLNDTATRRNLMLNILHKNPEEYIDLLQRTRSEADVEITHYATTTMMKLQTTYEQKLQQLSARYQANPQHIPILRAYEKELSKYIESGLISENILQAYRVTLDEVLTKLVALVPEQKRYHMALIENAIALGKYDVAEEYLKRAKKAWALEEKIYMLYVQLYYAQGDGERIQNVLEEVRENQIYLSHNGREWYRFWKQGEVAYD